jgi:hypothetical protein
LACGPRTEERASLGLSGGGGVRAEDSLSSGMTGGSHKSAAQGAGVRAAGSLGRKASLAACGAGLLRGWKRQGRLASAAVGPAGCCGLLRPDGLGGGGLGRVGLKV